MVKMLQTAFHVLLHVAAKKPRVGEVQVAVRKHLLVSRNEDHIGVKVGTNCGMFVKVSPCRTRYKQHAVAAGIIFRHT